MTSRMFPFIETINRDVPHQLDEGFNIPYKDKEKQRAYRRQYYLDHRDKELEWDRAYRKRHPDRLKIYGRKLKIEVLGHYSGGTIPVCVKCGFTDIRALSIDHINGRGRAERAKKGRHGTGFYALLKREKYPEGYQTLCMNCQWIKRWENKELERGANEEPKNV